MTFEWIAMEHQRLHLVEEWPDGPYKQAALAAIHSTLDGLLRTLHHGAALPVCEVCLNRKKPVPLPRPELFQLERSGLAA